MSFHLNNVTDVEACTDNNKIFWNCDCYYCCWSILNTVSVWSQALANVESYGAMQNLHISFRDLLIHHLMLTLSAYFISHSCYALNIDNTFILGVTTRMIVSFVFENWNVEKMLIIILSIIPSGRLFASDPWPLPFSILFFELGVAWNYIGTHLMSTGHGVSTSPPHRRRARDWGPLFSFCFTFSLNFRKMMWAPCPSSVAY